MHNNFEKKKTALWKSLSVIVCVFEKNRITKNPFRIKLEKRFP